jgi:hypothetical protein
MPPKKRVAPVKILTFPGSFSGAKTSVRKNLKRVMSSREQGTGLK